MSSSTPARWAVALAALLAVRLLLGLYWIAELPPPSVDDFFRPYHAVWWWQRPSFAPSGYWLPGYAWLFGAVVGLVGDARAIAPTNLLLHLGTGLVLARAAGPDRGRAALALAFALFGPLAWRLGQSTLSEPLHGLLVVGAVALCGHRDGRRRALAALLAAGAALVRYDAFVLLPLFAYELVRARRRVREGALALVPLSVPAIWMVRAFLRDGDPFHFLHAVARDRFGAGNLAEALADPAGVATALQLVAAVAASAALLRPAASRGREAPPAPIARRFARFTLLSALFVAGASVTGSLPSQATERVLFGTVTLGSVPVAAVAGRLLPRARARAAVALAAALLLGALGSARLAALRDVRAPGTAAVAARLRALHAAGALPEGAHVLVEGPFLAAAAVVVDSPIPTRSHVEGAGRCPVHLLRCELDCARTDWPRRVEAVVTARAATARALRARGWSLRSGASVRPWAVFVRDGGMPLHACERPRARARR